METMKEAQDLIKLLKVAKDKKDLSYAVSEFDANSKDVLKTLASLK